MVHSKLSNSLYLPALFLVLLACKGAPGDDRAKPVASAAAAGAESRARKLALDGMTLEQLEKAGEQARWKVRSSSEHGDAKSLHTLSVILEDKEYDGYITLFRFSDKPTAGAAAIVGKQRALLVTSEDLGENPGKQPGAGQLLDALAPGGDVDKLSRDSLKDRAKAAGWKVESSQLDTDRDEGVGYTMLEIELSKAEDVSASVQLFDYEKSVSGGRAVLDGSRVLIVSVPEKQSMAQPILSHIRGS